MKHWERVMKAIRHEVPDRVPYGELEVPLQVAGDFLGKDTKDLSPQEGYAIKKEFFTAMDMDLVVVPGYQWIDGQCTFNEASLVEVKYWRQNSDLFVFALVNGGFGQTMGTYGLNELLIFAENEPTETTKLIASIIEENLAIAEKMVEAGAHAVIIGDDFAYARDTFISPILLKNILFKSLGKAMRKIKSWGVPAFLHVDGNINRVLSDVIDLGIDGLHSIQPTAGMDIGAIKKEYGKKICLMGNLDIELFYWDDKEALEKAVDNLIETIAPRGGFILSTSSGLDEGIKLSQLRVLRDAALKIRRG